MGLLTLFLGGMAVFLFYRLIKYNQRLGHSSTINLLKFGLYTVKAVSFL